MTPLEQRYRRVLRLLPSAYRRVWEEEMTATFLDTMRTGDPDRDEHAASWGRPSAAEVASVAGLAVRLRLGGLDAPVRSSVWGEAVRLVALVGLLLQAVAGTTGLAHEAWLAGRLPWPPVPAQLAELVASPSPPGPADLVAGAVPVLWVAAFLALVADRRRAARALAALAFAPGVLGAVAATAGGLAGRAPLQSVVLATWADALVTGGALLGLAAFHREAPAARPRPWLIAYGVGLAVAPVPAVLFLAQPLGDVLLLDWPGVWSIALTAAGAVHLARGRGVAGRRRAAWSLALALLAGGVLPLRALTLLAQALAPGAGATPATMAIGMLELTGVIVVGVPLAALAARTLRSLPPGSHRMAPPA